MGWLHTGEAGSSLHGQGLILQGQIVKLTSGVGLSFNILILAEDANTTADSDGCSLVVTWNMEEERFSEMK